MNDEDEFEFILYVSFQNRETSMGLELCEALDQFCKKHDLRTFRLVTRLSQGFTGSRPPRWDETYIMQELGRLKKIQRVCVCGPPIISEIFDKTFEKIGKGRFNGLKPDMLDVL